MPRSRALIEIGGIRAARLADPNFNICGVVVGSDSRSVVLVIPGKNSGAIQRDCVTVGGKSYLFVSVPRDSVIARVPQAWGVDVVAWPSEDGAKPSAEVVTQAFAQSFDHLVLSGRDVVKEAPPMTGPGRTEFELGMQRPGP